MMAIRSSCGLNEGVLPQVLTPIVFSNSLRQTGLDDNNARYARDAYLLRTILESRKSRLFCPGKRCGESRC